MGKFKLFFKQLFCWHEWDKVRGYDTPIPGAKCKLCGKVHGEAPHETSLPKPNMGQKIKKGL